MKSPSVAFLLLVLPAFAQDARPPSAEPAPAAPLLDEPPAALSLFGDSGGENAAPSSGEELLAACAARMPAERVLLAGHLNMRKAYGVSLREFDFAVDARLGDDPPRLRYDLKDAAGSNLLSVAAVRDPARGLVLSRPDGGPAPKPSDSVLGTDLSWFDVGVDFVWWKNPTLAGTDRLKGRTCDLLDVTPPEPTPDCAKARLWIDRAQKVVMQAVQLDANGRARRKLWIRATQKVEGRWVFKDLEVETTGTGHRTRLHFDDVSFPDSAPRDAER
ncbi:MAG: outer membrane lipoprotein-sorting protein [Kiritimatiellae bacterium]|nr:outer membrane lipoprotein-sorting protein [Kiritimatiellia bacterium]